MKKYLAAVLFLIPLCGIAQWEDPEEQATIEVFKPDSIFYIKDINAFIDKEELEMGDSAENGSIYLLKRMHSLMASREALNVYIAIKEKKQYRVWDITAGGFPPATSVNIVGWTKVNNRKLLEIDFSHYFMHHGYNPVMNNFISCTGSMMLVDTDKDEIVFGREYYYHASTTFLWDLVEGAIIDSTDTGTPVFIFTESGDTVDMAAYPDESTWYRYIYQVKNNRIEFFKIDAEPVGECFDEEKNSIAGQKPDFWYEYVPDKRMWRKKEQAKK